MPIDGVPLSLPSAPTTVTGFTAQSPNFVVAEDSSASLTLVVSGAPLTLACTAYPNNSVVTSGITTTHPTGSPIDPVIAIAGSVTGSTTTTTVPSGGGGGSTPPYELYCPGTPVGNIVLNDTVTQGTVTPNPPAIGQPFNLTDFQTSVTLPGSIVSAVAALGNASIPVTTTLNVDVTGATPPALSSGLLSTDVPIPIPVPAVD